MPIGRSHKKHLNQNLSMITNFMIIIFWGTFSLFLKLEGISVFGRPEVLKDKYGWTHQALCPRQLFVRHRSRSLL
jgi:hypothetical protein